MTTDPVMDLVTACKALAARGCDTGIGGHVSIRDPAIDEFWINSFDRTLGEMTAADVVKLDHAGTNVLNDRVVSPGWEFHAGIYSQRPDINAIVHTHGFWVTALASLSRPLRMRHNLCTLFYQDQVMSPDDSFDSIGATLGQASTIIIPWHGAITVGRTIGRAAALHATLEDMAKLDVTLDQSDAPELPEHARLPLRKLIDEVACYLEQTWELMTRQAERYNP
ncbi:MAG: class II aldolase/adducin family protein [Acidimicrobiales bacterium]|jgi:L-fuculose-phosphate aldolase